MAYKLKQGQPPFQVVDGPMARKRFLRGKEYSEIPEAEKHRFEPVKKKKTVSVASSQAGKAQETPGGES